MLLAGLTQKTPKSGHSMRFPVRIKHRGRTCATIYAKSKSYALYRVAWTAGGSRKMKTFPSYSEARRHAYAVTKPVQTRLGIEVVIPMKKNMDIWADAWALAQRESWQQVPEVPPPVVPIPPARPERLRRREANRQKTLAQRKQALPPPPAQERYTQSEYCWMGGFGSWTAATVPIAVVCLRDHYADGHHEDWALMSTYPGPEPLRLLGYYRRRPAIEERHRQLKCFYDLSDFRSRSFNAIAAQVVRVLLTYTLRQWQLWRFLEEALARLTPEGLAQQLRLLQQWIVIYLGLAYTQLPVVSFTREALQLEGAARDKALRKLELLERTLLTPVPNPRPR